jgi:phosphate transport system protein
MKRFFDDELESLRSNLFLMGEKVIAQLRLALRAYVESDPNLAQQAIDADNEIDDLEMLIDEEAIKYMSLRTPVATRMRVIVTGMKASHDFERAGDEVTKIARSVRRLATAAPLKLQTDVARMGDIAGEMLRESLDCLIRGAEERALAVCQRDTVVDDMNRELKAELITLMTQNPETVSRSVDLIVISKAIERVADHASNIAESTIYLVKAKDVRHSPELKHGAVS